MKSKSIRVKLLAIIGIISIASSVTAYACYKKKQCCKRDYTGSLTCITKCDYEYCPYDYPIEIK